MLTLSDETLTDLLKLQNKQKPDICFYSDNALH